MVSLAEAFKLTRVRDNECVRLVNIETGPVFGDIKTGKEVRDSLDLHKVECHRIDVSASSFMWEFTVKYGASDL